MILFDSSGDNSTDANTVAAHSHNLLFALFIQNSGIHSFTVFSAQLEYMPYFNTAFNFQNAFTIGAGVAGHYIANISLCFNAAISSPIDTSEVVAIAIGTADKVSKSSCAMIHNQRNIKIDWSQRAHWAL